MEESKIQEERELNFICDIIVRLTKENAENPTPAVKRLFRWAYHEIWMLKSFAKPLASEKAYKLFFDETGKDIRDFGWDDVVKDKKGNRVLVRKNYMHEHMIPSSMVEKMLMKEFKQGNLTLQKVKEIISKQRICWVLRTEDDELNRLGYRSYRANPVDAYKDVGITLYEENTEKLRQMFEGLNLKELLNNGKTTDTQSDNEKEDNNEHEIPQAFQDLKQYFIDNPTFVNGHQIRLTTYKNVNYATIFRSKGVWVNVRLNSNKGGGLLDVGMYFEGEKSNEHFFTFALNKDRIESYLGELVWQPFYEKKLMGKAGKASRISRYGQFASPSRASKELVEKIRKNPYNFDSNNIKKIAKELVKYYEVFVDDKFKLLDN